MFAWKVIGAFLLLVPFLGAQQAEIHSLAALLSVIGHTLLSIARVRS